MAVGLLAITGTTYAIRSGGHSPFKDFASTDNGVLIAMHQMKSVDYDAGTETARLGMGNTWGDVYGALVPKQRIVVGGRIPPVGMALVTGGQSFCMGSKLQVGANMNRFQVGFHIYPTSMASPATKSSISRYARLPLPHFIGNDQLLMHGAGSPSRW